MDADPQPERFYAGEFRHSIDEKNRITIPSRWRRDRPEDFILLPEATHQFLLVMSPEEFAKMGSAAEMNEKVSARDRRVFLRQLHHAPLRKNKFWSFDIRRVSRFVFCYESFTELIECPAFNFCARPVHQIQIKMQIVQRDQTQPENFLRLDEMANVAAREFAAGGTHAVFFDGPFVPSELRVL